MSFDPKNSNSANNPNNPIGTSNQGTQPAGNYELTYFKYLEDSNGNVRTVKEWTRELIKTTSVDVKDSKILEEYVEVNGLGKIPAIIAYSQRSPVRGIGVSDINDISGHELEQIKYFFQHYKDLEYKQVVVGNFRGKKDAITILEQSIYRYISN